MREWLWLMLLAGCVGAGSAHYGAADNRRTVTADLGTIFYVSVPDSVREKPIFSPSVLSLAKDGVDEGAHERTLEFTARTPGETEIRIGAAYSGPGDLGLGPARHARQPVNRG